MRRGRRAGCDLGDLSRGAYMDNTLESLMGIPAIANATHDAETASETLTGTNDKVVDTSRADARIDAHGTYVSGETSPALTDKDKLAGNCFVNDFPGLNSIIKWS